MATPATITQYGVYASRPADLVTQEAGVLYYATDRRQWFEWNGAAWFEVFTNGGIILARVALAASDSGGGVFSWQNPESVSIVVRRVEIDVTTASTGACSVDVGVTATSSTTNSDNLIDGLSVAATGVSDNLGNPGTNGKTRQKLASGKWVTASMATGATSGLVGYAYLEYHIV